MGPKEQLLRQMCASRGLRYVGTRGNTSAPIVFVGEAPGSHEDAELLPFVGSSGKELDRMAAEAGISNLNNEAWFTNPYKVRPPSNDISRIGEYGIDDQSFTDQFFEELEAHKPVIIFACGATPLALLCPATCSRRDGEAKIGQWRGSLLRSPRLSWEHYVIPVHHPAFILRDWTERPVAVLCIARGKEEADYYKANGKLQPLPERELIVTPNYSTIIEYLHWCDESPLPIAADIELMGKTINGKTKYLVPDMIAIARSAKSAISFDLWAYPIDELVKIWGKLDGLLRTKKTIGQNWTNFDCHWLELLGFSPVVPKVDDTLVRHHVLWPEFEHKLHFQVLQYTREPYYKDEGRLWRPADGRAVKQRYNAKDAALTYEVFDEQEKEFDDRPHLRDFYANYEMKLAQRFFEIEKRGLLVDPDELKQFRIFLEVETTKACLNIEKIIGRPVRPDKESAAKVGKDCININAPQQVLALLQALKLKVPVKRGTGKQSTDEKTLQAIFTATGNMVCKHILRVRELNKMKGTYVDVTLADNVLYTSFVTTATVTGRRGSRTNVFNLGTNLQNLPKHGDLAKPFRKCLVARPGKIFVQVDQKGAEDWIVQGIISDVSGVQSPGLGELLAGINRHRKRAAFLFSKPESECTKESVYYFMGKKAGHAGNYDMKELRLAEEFTKEGFHVPVNYCRYMLAKFHEYEPGIKQVFHAWIQKQILDFRKLQTPLGRERVFWGLRPFSDNSDIFREAYAYIPQSTVGDNTGMAIVYYEDRRPGEILLDGHDAILCEVDDNIETVTACSSMLQEAFNRVIRFPVSGLELTIPIELEMGYNLKTMVSCPDISQIGLANIYATLPQDRNRPKTSTTGQPSPQSQPPYGETAGTHVP